MPSDESLTDGASVCRTVTIVNQRGLHARAAAKFVKLAGQFTAQVFVSKRGTEVSGLSIMGLMMLAAGPGSKLTILATGADAPQAIAEIEALVKRKFDEE